MTNDATPSRRQVLLTSGFGLAAAAFLAACGSDADKAGSSGAPATTTSVPPTVPPLEATPAALDLDQTLLRTGSSLELLAAEVYTTYGNKLDDPAWQAAATRFAADHTANADVFGEATNADKRVNVPNAAVRGHLVSPVVELLDSEAAVLDFFRDIESTLAATYVTAAGSFTTAEWRAQVSAFAAASARRVGVLGNGGEGQATGGALFPLDDLISQTDYLLNTPVAAEAPAE